ncbi:MAG: heparinase II/III family protein, partial [Gemmatimonadales bacterium]|nr:heparinase II/III family protein [Gemmatimonadales bacterium]
MQDVRFADQRSVSDDDFLQHLRLPGTLGRRLTAARAKCDRPSIVGAVAEHFRTRSGPRWPFYMHGSPWMEINGRGEVMEKADGLLANRFRSSWPPFQSVDLSASDGGFDWKKGMAEIYGTLSRSVVVAELSTAFALTGDTRYLVKARDFIRAFVDGNPFLIEEGFFEDHDRYFGGGFNNSGDVYSRSKRWLDLMHCGALQVPGIFSDEDVFWLVKQLWFYAMQYYRLVGDVLRRDNHHLTDHGGAAFFYGVMFPEFSIAKKLAAEGARVIRHHFTSNMLADGDYAEHCTKYQYHITYMLGAPLALAKANGIRLLSAKQERQFGQWVEFLANATKPDGILVEFGDEFGGSLAQLFCINGTPMMSPRIAAMARALGYEPGKLSSQTPAELTRFFKRWTPGTSPRIGLSPWFTHGRNAAKPAKAALPNPTVRYPLGGFSFFRSDWTPAADYLAVSHYTESLPHSHVHWDMMSFVLHTGGQTLIGDPATWLYTDQRHFDETTSRENRGYLYSVDAHNCLVMNDDTL